MSFYSNLPHDLTFMDNFYTFFLDESENPELQQARYSISVSESVGGIDMILSALTSCSEKYRGEQKAAAEEHVRMKAAYVIRRAVQENDDRTILRWYSQEFFTSSILLSDTEKQRAELALQRQKYLQTIRKREVIPDAKALEFLQGSNLLTRIDRFLFSKSIS